MKKNNNILIIGCNIPSLYAAIKCIDLGYNVSIVEKKKSYTYYIDDIYYNFNYYNDSHKTYINLLKQYDINSIKLTNKIDNRLLSIINNIILKTKYIPTNILTSYTLYDICKYILNKLELYDFLQYQEIFYKLFISLNALNCINLLINDILYNNYYYVDNDNINMLCDKMITYIKINNGKIYFDKEVKNIKYIKKKFILNFGKNSNNLVADYLITTISRNNLNKFIFWNTQQKKYLNTVYTINSSYIKTVLDRTLYQCNKNIIEQSSNEIQQYLLEELHIVYPKKVKSKNKNKFTYIWHTNNDYLVLQEKIRNMYNNKFFICSESFSKNNLFLNYSLEYIDKYILYMFY